MRLLVPKMSVVVVEEHLWTVEEHMSVQEYMRTVEEVSGLMVEEAEVFENEIGLGDVQSIGEGRGNSLRGWILCRFSVRQNTT